MNDTLKDTCNVKTLDERSNSQKDLEYKVYLEERKLLIDAEREGSRSFDKTILTLSAGAFGISLTFIRQIVPNIETGTLFLLILGWTGFTISMLATLISFLTSQRACARQREILEENYFNKSDLFLTLPLFFSNKGNAWGQSYTIHFADIGMRV